MECCDVCCDEVRDIKDVIILKCNHAYHKSCYFKWLNKNDENICPICLFSYSKHRKKFKKKFINKKKSELSDESLFSDDDSSEDGKIYPESNNDDVLIDTTLYI